MNQQRRTRLTIVCEWHGVGDDDEIAIVREIHHHFAHGYSVAVWIYPFDGSRPYLRGQKNDLFFAAPQIVRENGECYAFIPEERPAAVR